MRAEKTVRVEIEGRVQGVWFRGWTLQESKRLGLAGWVRNRRDGSVEAVFSGNADDVDEMCQLCYAGPGSAAVTSVRVFDAEPPDHLSFEARPTE